MEEKRAEQAILQTKSLTKYFRTPRGLLHAVDHVDLSIPANKTLGVVGESGCGKSTLGRTILKLIEPTEGEILYKGANIEKYTPAQMREMRRKMQIIFQDPYASLNPRKTVKDLIADPLKVYQVPKAERNRIVSEIMATVGLAERFAQSYPHELDGGRRQRIGIARSLVLQPEFIVCDEPVSALDVSIQAQILNLLMDLQQSHGLTYLFITHDLSVVRHISDEIMVMYLGVVVERAPSKELFSNPLHPYTKELIRAIPIPDLKPEHRLVHSIRGEVSDPIEPPARCRFAPRCNHCTEACMNRQPVLKDMGSQHYVACALYES
ncbi:ATP-binding cassette domain-containing protein [Oscillibacter sp. MSJ-2]|uniref:ATP-binding cassette domain-containing protein n=1 Tax=Dysosmobacter acutus TaxID=2841504 RepID=A0ABS6F6G5_9FIRM|nr:oligopeptide/dipeptide ABC transporter ATP-binding protein [Dysosmobacter acutus]MBU5625860.1 ATP-binding cassette domain-containing protein [Dysosmobacter acutus]